MRRSSCIRPRVPWSASMPTIGNRPMCWPWRRRSLAVSGRAGTNRPFGCTHSTEPVAAWPRYNPRMKCQPLLPEVIVVIVVIVAIAVPSEAQTTAAKSPVTFTKGIAPLLLRSCQQCHRPDSVAPMSLISYEDVRPYARAIKLRTALRGKPGVMPPWYIEKNVGIQHFKDDISLSDEEIENIAAWADAGAPKGNPADMPPPRTFADATVWSIGTPDLIVSSPTVKMKALAPDWCGSSVESPTNLSEDRYVAAVEIKEVNDLNGRKSDRTTVGGLYLVHHAAFFVIAPDGRNSSPGGWPVH